MKLRTILNRVQRVAGFVDSAYRLLREGRLEIELRPPANESPVCSGCTGPSFHGLAECRSRLMPLFGLPTSPVYAMTCVDGPRCDRPNVERVARISRKHRSVLLNRFRNGEVHCLDAVDGLIGKAAWAIRKCAGSSHTQHANERCITRVEIFPSTI